MTVLFLTIVVSEVKLLSHGNDDCGKEYSTGICVTQFCRFQNEEAGNHHLKGFGPLAGIIETIDTI